MKDTLLHVGPVFIASNKLCSVCTVYSSEVDVLTQLLLATTDICMFVAMFLPFQMCTSYLFADFAVKRCARRMRCLAVVSRLHVSP